MKNKSQKTMAILFSDAIRSLLKCILEGWASLTHSRFYCNDLTGESEYNISINSDMSVSCNCQDSGDGILGYLDEDSFDDIFYGAKAYLFREALSKGRLPVLTCTRCSELKRLKRGETLPPPRLPYRGMMLENTIDCNLNCPGCIRKEVLKWRRKATLTMENLAIVTPLFTRLGLKKTVLF